MFIDYFIKNFILAIILNLNMLLIKAYKFYYFAQ